MKHKLYLLITLVVFIWSFVVFSKISKNTFYHPDEVSWFFHTEFFDQLFLRNNLHNNFWKSIESFDQPPLTKYIYGSYLYVKDKSVFDERDKLETEYGRWAIYRNWENINFTKEFTKYINWMREINVFFAALVVAFSYLIFLTLSKNFIFSLLLPLSLLGNYFFTTTLVRATSDAQYLAFMLLSFCFAILYLEKKKASNLILCSIFAGLSLSSKLTGGLILITFFVSGVYFAISQRVWKKSVEALGTILLIAGTIWIVVNPALYRSPIENSINYVDFRLKQTRRLQSYYQSDAHLTINTKIKSVYCTLLSSSCSDKYFKGTLVNITLVNVFLIITGFCYLIIKVQKDNETSLYKIFMIFCLTTMIVTMLYLPLNFDRYYLPVLIIFYMIQFLGVKWVYDFIKNRLFLKLNLSH